MTGGGGKVQVVQVRGELDLALAGSLAARGYAAIGGQARVLLLDVAGVSFCDACGLSAGPDRQSRRPNRVPLWPHRAAAAGGEDLADHQSGPAAARIHQH